MPRIAPDRGLNDEELWDGWTEICTEKIEELSEQEFLVLMVNDPENVFVQIARMSPNELLCEVSLGEHYEDHQSAVKSLVDLGWHPPGSYVPGPNLQCVWRSETKKRARNWITNEDARDAAGLLASTLRYVLGITDPTKIPVTRDTF